MDVMNPDDPLDRFIAWAMFTINMSQPIPRHLAGAPAFTYPEATR